VSRAASTARLELLGLILRPISHADGAALAGAFARLSPTSRYRRFLAPKPRLTMAELAFLTDLDPTRHRALGAFDRRDGQLIGVARYVRYGSELERADMAVAVIDDWHRRGIARVLVGELIAVAVRDGIVRLSGTTLAENAAARNLLRGLGFQATGAEGDTIDYALEIAAHGAEPAASAAA
jgi:GNAT superfamily N-acetyltransferase